MAAAAPKKITAFNVGFKEDQADEWFANAQQRLLTFHPGPAGGAGTETGPKSTLIELIRTVLPGILLNSYHRDDLWAHWNAENAANNAESDRLVTEMINLEQKLKPNTLYSLNDAHRRQLTRRKNELPTLLYGANGPLARITERKDKRRQTIRRRQVPFITQIKTVIDHSTLLTGAEKAEVTLFVDGLIHYFKKKYEHITGMNGNIRYNLSGSRNAYGRLSSDFNDQVRTLDPSVTGSENVRRGIAKLTANTRAAAAAVSRVPGFEEFNADMNRVLFNPGASNEEVIAKIAAMTPEMMSRLETQIEDKVKLNALESRLASLRSLPAEGTSAYSSLDQLTTRLEALRVDRVLFNPSDSSITTKEIIDKIASLSTQMFDYIKTKLSDTTKRTALLDTLKKLARSSDNPSEDQTGYPQVRRLMALLAETKKGGGRHTRRARRRMRRTRR